MDLDFEKENGLIPAIVQDHANGEILMLGFMNREALDRTQKTGFVTFYSRSRKKLWTKGETSGQKLLLRELRVDCDQDALLVRAEFEGGAVCHEGYRSCFFRRIARTATRASSRNAYSLPRNSTAKGKSNEPLETRHSQRQLAGIHCGAFRQSRMADFRQFAQLLPRNRRSGNRMHDGSRAGNGALRGERRAGRRPHGQGLDTRDRRGNRRGRRAGLLEDQSRARALGAGRRRGFADANACAISKEK